VRTGGLSWSTWPAAPRSAGSRFSHAGGGRNTSSSVAGTGLCMAPHQQYQLSGLIHVLMADGAEVEAGPGEIASLPPGHDAWVVGDEPVVAIDWQGASVWARPQEG
jgi:hypothetical protein